MIVSLITADTSSSGAKYRLVDHKERGQITQRSQAGHPREGRVTMKKNGPKRASVSLRRFQLSLFNHLITTVLFAFWTVGVPTLPSAWAFMMKTRNAANFNYKYYDSRTNSNQFFGERKSLGDAECSSLPSEQQRTAHAERSPESKNTERKRKSRISGIRCENFAGMTNGQHGESPDGENVIALNFYETTAEKGLAKDDETSDNAILGDNLVCVTGETGSGKSLLVSKIADLLTGGKATATLLHGTRNATSMNSDDDEQVKTASHSAASVEMVLSLYDEAHTSFVSKTLRRMGLDPTILLGSERQEKDNCISLTLKRVISITPAQRMKSTCFINGHSVPLKVLKAISSPLIAVVNAPVAATALGRPALRLSMIDSGIPTTVLAWVHRLQTTYRKAKQYRESLERELENQVLPASVIRRGVNNGGERDASASDNDQQFELLRHWIEELDGFQRRISDLKDSLCSGVETSTNQIGDEELEILLSNLNALDWTSAPDYNADDAYTASLYETLLDLHDYLKLLDGRIIAAKEARESLASLSVSDSARVALDRTRQLLMDAAAAPPKRNVDSTSAKSRVSIASEKAHEMLNLVEDALSECANFLDDDEKGLVSTLESSRTSCSTSTEDLLEYISEWNILARKHGVSPYQLPSCHGALKSELEGGIEAGRLLPEAKIAEKKALDELENACQVLTEARSKLCRRVSDSISRRLPRLGMDNSKFEVRLRPVHKPSFSNSHLGVDEVDFFLLHEDPSNPDKRSNKARAEAKDRGIGGKIESVASSGEKARVLLAIECEIPGAIGATSRESLVRDEEDQSPHISPVAVIYDEIDAHVGGRASVSVGQMLFDQSKSCQVLSITHSPSLAAIADTHICVRRGKSDTNGRMFDVLAYRVEGIERRKELARMASGDMVMDEAEVFAEALLRDASSIKTRTPKLQP